MSRWVVCDEEALVLLQLDEGVEVRGEDDGGDHHEDTGKHGD